MLDCKEFIKCLSAYMDGELDESILVQFEEHIETCKSARAVVQTFRRTILLHQESGGTPVPTDVHERLLEAIHKCSCGDD